MFGIRKLRKAIEKNELTSLQLGAMLNLNTMAVHRLNATLCHFVHISRPPNPIGNFNVRFKEETMSGIAYYIDIPELQAVPSAADVVQGEITLTYDGVPQEMIQVLKGDDGAFPREAVSPAVPKGTMLGGSFVWRDDDGLASETPLTFPEFEVKDTQAPPSADSGFGLRFKEEIV